MNSDGNSSQMASVCPSDFPLSYTKVQYKVSTVNDAITVIICVVNIITCPIAVVLNTLMLTVILKQPLLRSMKNISLIFLAFSDLLVCAVAQTSFIANEVNILMHGQVICTVIFAINLYTEILCIGLSFFTLKVMTLERFAAIFAPYWFLKNATKARITITYGAFWFLWTAYITIVKFIPNVPESTYTSVLSTFIFINFLFTIMVYLKINKLQKAALVQPIRCPQSTARALSQTKSTRTVIYINMTLFLSYFPVSIVVLIHRFGLITNDVLIYHILYPLSQTALFNSAVVNPIIYSWRCSEIRASLRRLFKKPSVDVNVGIPNAAAERFTGRLNAL